MLHRCIIEESSLLLLYKIYSLSYIITMQLMSNAFTSQKQFIAAPVHICICNLVAFQVRLVQPHSDPIQLRVICSVTPFPAEVIDSLQPIPEPCYSYQSASQSSLIWWQPTP